MNYDDFTVWTLVERIEEEHKYDEFVTNARDILNSLQQAWLLKSPSLNFDESDFSTRIKKIWEDQCFVDSLRLSIEETTGFLQGDILSFSKKDTPAERFACMESDLSFKTLLEDVKPDTDTTTILRLLLTILITYWTDHDVLMNLDAKMGGPHFKKKFDQINRVKAHFASREKAVEPEVFSFNMKSAGDLEGLREKLTERHSGGNKDIEAMVTRIQAQLEFLLELDREHFGYDGGKATVYLRGFDGWYNVASIGEYGDV